MKFLSFRSLSRSIDENETTNKSDVVGIRHGILGDIMSKIEAEIRNYEDMLEV